MSTTRVTGRLRFGADFADNPDIQSVFQLLTGAVLVSRPPAASVDDRVYVDAVAELADGTVIADFFVPYILGSDCRPIQFTLPRERPRFMVQRSRVARRPGAQACDATVRTRTQSTRIRGH